MKEIRFERALFLSWFCSRGDCAFCYMSTQKKLIRDPRRARRSPGSIFAEAIISHACGWEIEFLSGGYDSYTLEEIAEIARNIRQITGKKQWLNIGALSYKEISVLGKHAQGYVGTLECANPALRRRLCPSKPLAEILQCFAACERLGLSKGITLIIGLGETIRDFAWFRDFVAKNRVERVTFYSLNPQKGTAFKTSPKLSYYRRWIELTRREFAQLHITAGAWSDKLEYFPGLVESGADSITKLPALRFFGTRKAHALERMLASAGRFRGTFTRVPRQCGVFGVDAKYRGQTAAKLASYLKRLTRT